MKENETLSTEQVKALRLLLPEDILILREMSDQYRGGRTVFRWMMAMGKILGVILGSAVAILSI